MADLPPIDFVRLAAELLSRAEQFVSDWLPGGRRIGHEWVCGSLSGGEGRSCSVNLNTGKWADFQSGEAGRDLTSLFAAINDLNNGQAAVKLMTELGWRESTPGSPAVRTSAPAPAPTRSPAPEGDGRPEPPAADPGSPVADDDKWRPIAPVPADTPAARFKHWHHGEPDRIWKYERDGELYGYVCRFDKPPSAKRPKGGKEIIPLVWAEDTSDGRGTRRWEWKQWREPRPLYLAAGLLAVDPALVPVVLVEGEKCADAGHALLPEFDWVSWPGGANAWAKADWSWLKGRVVYLWPDCDSKRAKLSKHERDTGVDQATKPIMPAVKQPGTRAMVGIGSQLAAAHGCQVLMCQIPAPGDVSDGWDVADAIEQGWNVESVRAFVRRALPFVPPDDAARASTHRAGLQSTPSFAAAGDGEGGADPNGWRQFLLTSSTGAIKAVRENIVLAFDGAADTPGVPVLQGVIAFNEFTNDCIKLRAAPWGSPAGVWAEVDELLLGEWLVREQFLPSMSRGTLEEAVSMVGYRHRYHPVREYLTGLEWDGIRRLSTWLRRVCMIEDEFDDRDPLQQYLKRVGAWFLMGMCKRAMQPGCKFDYMLIMEGPQGYGKSTLLRVLAGDWFSDTGLVLGDKDSFQQLQGRWLYEIGELDAFSKTDITKIKNYIASQTDYFRASFDRRAREYPRQLVFGGTTNEDHYLVDPTGNRRFWPVRVQRHVDIEWLTENRDQLFAEAMRYIAEGRRMHPTPEEQAELFEPQQQLRAVENAIEIAISRYLHDDLNGQCLSKTTTVEILSKVGIDIAKLGPGRYHEKQAAAALRKLGWAQEGRSSAPGRPRYYVRPTSEAGGSSAGGQQQRPTQGNSTEGLDDDCPF